MSSAVFSIKAKRNDTWLWKQLTSGWWWENIVSRVSASFRWIWMFFRYSVSHEASVNARSRNKHGGREQNRGTVRPARTTQTARTIKRSHTWWWSDNCTWFTLQITNQTPDQREDTSTGGNSTERCSSVLHRDRTYISPTHVSTEPLLKVWTGVGCFLSRCNFYRLYYRAAVAQRY